jgi:ABC-2 type transport system permease protein
MNGASLALRQFRFVNKSFWRNPASAFFTFAFPLLFLVIFTLLFGNSTTEVGPNQTVSTSTFYVPAILAFSVITACFTNIAIGITFERDEGILKRIRGTPMPGWAYLMARILHAIFIMLILVAIVVAFGALFYDAELPTDNIGGFLATLIVGSATFCALGLAISPACPNAEASPAIVNATILPLLFISGIFVPLEVAPDWLVTFAELFPVKHFADAIIASYFSVGSGLQLGDLWNIVLWGIAGVLLSVNFFSWEPRR